MNRITLGLAALLAPVALASAESTVTISKTHLCCNNCVQGVAKAVKPVTGATAKCDRNAQTITITAADEATVQKAVDAIAAAGYFGKAEGAKMVDDSGAKPGDVQSAEISGLHNCCNKCTTTINDTIKAAGAKGTTKAKETTFTVTGPFDPVKLVQAFNDAGFNVKVASK